MLEPAGWAPCIHLHRGLGDVAALCVALWGFLFLVGVVLLNL